MILIAILIRVDTKGSVIYAPRMIGIHSKPFRLLRFRTMESQPTTSADTHPGWTRVGRFLRNYSLDHLPMLFNLLRGDLTLIGPRPMESASVDPNDPVWQDYFAVKPGLFNYAVLKLGSQWTPMRTSQPALNQELELEYQRQRTSLSDVQLFWNFIQAYLLSRGNVKAIGKMDSRLGKSIHTKPIKEEDS